MQILLNGETKEAPAGLTLASLLDHFDLPKQRIAVEVNLQLIRRGEWDKTQVAQADRIEVIHFVGGG